MVGALERLHARESLGSYRLLERLGRGGMGAVYRAEHVESGLIVALKTVELADQRYVQSIRREIQSLARMRHPGIVRILDHGFDAGVPWYAMELVAGTTLAASIGAPIAQTAVDDAASAVSVPARARRVAIDEVLRIVELLCEPLAYLHGEGLVHRDLKPANVLIRSDQRPVLVDFGLAFQFGRAISRERLEAEHHAGGTAAYMSPEQIRGEYVDARSDLYALGCVFYELLTGQPPFAGFTAARVLEKHLQETPLAPSSITRDVPNELDQIVLRLLAKDPRDRYGYAEDVSAVLRGEWPERSKQRTYLYRPRLAGRSTQLAELGALLNSPPRAALIGGESGVGKTRLVMDFARTASSRGFVVLIGEGMQEGSRPLELFRAPLRVLADRCRELGREECARVLGSRAVVLADYEPSIAKLPGVSEQPAPPSLPPEAARRRVFEAVHDTFSLFAGSSRLLFVLDDLQWADELSLGYLAFALEEARSEQIAVLGTYRAEEVTEALARFLAGGACSKIALDRLGETEVESMVADMLAMKSPPEALVSFVARRSEGNPFFAGEYLRAAVHEGIVSRVPLMEWRLLRPLDVLAPGLRLPETVRELVRWRLRDLGAESRALLATASVIGRESSLDLLLAASGLDEETAFASLAELSMRQVLEEAVPGTLRFLHDQIREAIYAEQDPEALRGRHQRVADALDLASFAGGEAVYARAFHHSLGRANLRRVFETNVDAAERALKDHAPAESAKFFHEARGAADSAGVYFDSRLFGLWSEACIRAGRLRDATERLGEGIERADDLVARAGLRSQLASVHLAAYDSREASLESESALRDLGVEVGSSMRNILSTIADWSRGIAARRSKRWYGTARGRERRRMETLASTYHTALFAAFYEMDGVRFIQVALRALHPANRVGPSRHLVEAYSSYAIGLGSCMLRSMADDYANRAVAIAERLDDPYVLACSKISRALSTSMQGRLAESAIEMREALDRHGRWVEGLDYVNGAGDLAFNYAFRGYAREALATYEALLEKLRRTAVRADMQDGHPVLAPQLFVLPALSRIREAEEYVAKAQGFAELYASHHRAFLNGATVLYLREVGELGARLDHAIAAFKSACPAPSMLTPFHLRSFCVFEAHARYDQVLAGLSGALENFDRALAALARVALVPVYRCHLFVLRGARARLRRRFAAAAGLLDRAERSARESDSPWCLYELGRERMRLYRDMNDEAAAKVEARRARELAERHGWVARASVCRE